ncbi:MULTISPECIES: hypothetical protein [unclassified Bradyrhizobium]|uniref:hypothetical protein n=1 Tax=unclassified Bradyrhizobium TaxID=2631580 RepID=UPI002478D85F|nr:MULTISPECIES: hypothetical protein [unclassified Bradyrhizobium]WGS24118.1 hypothetical protein MTX22_29915 [Bradyrhizobium sp. ISRA463]WGS31538.1 hypothetical protein MTX19_27500 [Bradyrhizobium sp. ISRA464]
MDMSLPRIRRGKRHPSDIRLMLPQDGQYDTAKPQKVHIVDVGIAIQKRRGVEVGPSGC